MNEMGMGRSQRCLAYRRYMPLTVNLTHDPLVCRLMRYLLNNTGQS